MEPGPNPLLGFVINTDDLFGLGPIKVTTKKPIRSPWPLTPEGQPETLGVRMTDTVLTRQQVSAS